MWQLTYAVTHNASEKIVTSVKTNALASLIFGPRFKPIVERVNSYEARIIFEACSHSQPVSSSN